MPSNTAANGHDPRGRFIKGNQCGKGNTVHLQMAKFNRLLLDAVSPEDFKEVIEALVSEAKAKKPWAIRELLNRLCGKATQPVSITDEDGEPVNFTLEQYIKAARKIDNDTAGNHN